MTNIHRIVLLALGGIFFASSVSAVTLSSYTSKQSHYTAYYPSDWQLTKGLTNGQILLRPKKQKSNTSVYQIDVSPGSSVVIDHDAALYKGWSAYIQAYRDTLKENLSGSTDLRIVQYPISSAYPYAIKFVTTFSSRGYHYQRTDIALSNEGKYVMTVAGEWLYKNASDAVSPFRSEFNTVVEKLKIQFQPTVVLTDVKDGYSLRYPSLWTKVFPDPLFLDIGERQSTFIASPLEVKNQSYEIAVKKLNGSSDWSAEQQMALTKGWNDFVAQYVHDREQSKTDPLNIVSNQRYGLNGYTASILTTQEQNVIGFPTRHVIVLVTKDNKTVYAIEGGWFVLKKSGVMANRPDRYEFRALAQSFRILQ